MQLERGVDLGAVVVLSCRECENCRGQFVIPRFMEMVIKFLVGF
jgi:hypothetical protein